MFADILKIPVRNLGIDEITSRGAALSAGVGIGIYKDPTVAKTLLPASSKEYTPKKNDSKRYERYFEVFKGLNKSMEEIWDEMEDLN